MSDITRQAFLIEVSPGEYVASAGIGVTWDRDHAGRFIGDTALNLAREFAEDYDDRVRLVPIWDWHDKRRAKSAPRNPKRALAGV